MLDCIQGMDFTEVRSKQRDNSVEQLRSGRFTLGFRGGHNKGLNLVYIVKLT